MNVMRKLLDRASNAGAATPASGASGASTSAGRSSNTTTMYDDSGQPDYTLGLMHLRKLFSELKNPPTACSQKDLENMLYNMLPLFCKVFGSSPASDMLDKFPDVLQFCGHVSRLMVSEIRRRASNQSTDAASLAIVKFLEIESTEELSNGWMLLCTINLLSMGADSLIDCMTVASLPSTLVKCLYLFFDLPDVHNADVLLPGCEFTPRESRVLLQKVFVQVLVRLCSHTSPSEELARKDDLTLLFSAITSWCPVHNIQWRKSAAEVLITLSRYGLTPNVVQYIHSKGCIALCIDNMQRVQELSPIELVEMFVTSFCFLKDSSDVSQVLLDDFRACNGYVFLSEFLIKMEKAESEESMQALRNLVLLVGSLSTCGFIELKPSSKADSLYQMPGFTVPQPLGKGYSVRNLHAFQVLQTVFLKGTSSQLCSTILDVIASLYQQDSSNYFILEPHNTLSQFAEKIYLKPPEIQVKLMEIIEFIVFNLNFVPCKELITISIILKTNHSVECSILCMQTLHKLIRHHAVYKDVFREVGLIEAMVTCLHRYAALLKDPLGGNEAETIPDLEQRLGSLVMDALALILSANNSNASVFRECGGARCSHNMVPFNICRSQALAIVQQLVLCNGGDDDLGTLLGLMHTASAHAIQLKMAILKSLLMVLKESHRCRMIFRKVGGFVYVMSVLVSMEGSLADPPKALWDGVSRNDVLTLVRLIFSTLTIAMRFEPANARFFATEVRYASLTDAVRLLGCFEVETEVHSISPEFKPAVETPFSEMFRTAGGTELLPDSSIAVLNTLPVTLISATVLIRYLYDMALDNYDRPVTQPVHGVSAGSNVTAAAAAAAAGGGAGDNTGVRPFSLCEADIDGCFDAVLVQRPITTNNLSLSLSTAVEPFIVHPGAVISMLHLVPAIRSSVHTQLAVDLQWYICGIIKSLVRTERNQQVMCEALFPHELLSHATLALTDESHLIHQPLQYIFERLAAQSLTPKDLRDFLRLGLPLFCASEDEELYDAKRLAGTLGPTFAVTIDKLQDVDPVCTRKDNLCTTLDLTSCRKPKHSGGPVPLTRVKCLVSMTTPRDVRLHGTAITPSFVEFDMSAEGFGCLYLPSIAPQASVTPSVVSAGMIGGTEQGVVGGIGTGERTFPPAAGLSYSTWICVDKFSCVQSDPHPVRLLTIVRHLQARDDSLVCLSIYLSARDRALFISSHESPLTALSDVSDEPATSETIVRFWCPELTQEGQWHHVVIVFHKAGIMKNSSVSLYINATLVATQKLHYFSPYITSGSAAPSSGPLSVFAYVGTPPLHRRLSRLLWRQGPCHLIEDVVTLATVQAIYQLGPNYVGSLQAPDGVPDSAGLNITEERLVFGIHGHAMSLMTLAKIRKVYNKVDAKFVAKQLNMSDHENATPIRILHNSVAHLTGPARSFGAILIGYLGVRTFCPKPVAKVIMNIGGTSALLGLIAMANDVEGLYASVKALVCVVHSNRSAAKEMDRIKGYQTLAMLFKKKRHLLNSHILHLTFSLVGTLDSGRETSVIQHKTAFENLLCDLEIWHEAPCDLHKSLYEHFYELLTESNEHRSNLRLMQDLGLVSRLLHVLNDSSISRPTVNTIATLLTVLLSPPVHTQSLLRFGQFVVFLLPPASSPLTQNDKPLSNSEKCLSISGPPTTDVVRRFSPGGASNNATEQFDTSGSNIVFRVKLRNVCLDIISHLVKSPTGGVNLQFCEDLCKVLGFDWLMLFLQSHLHQSTVVSALSILVTMLQQQTLLQSFREAVTGGGWLRDTEPIIQNRVGVLLGFNIGGGAAGPNAAVNRPTLKREINQDVCCVPGFTCLQWLLCHHPQVSDIYFILMSLLLGQPLRQLPQGFKFDLDSVWSCIFGGSQSSVPQLSGKIDVCIEAAAVLLSMVRTMLNMKFDECCDELVWVKEYPVTVMQFLLYLYHNHVDFVPLSMSTEFLSALAATLFPYKLASESNSELMSPIEDFRPFPSSDQMVLVNFTEKPSTASATFQNNHPVRKFVVDFLRRIVVDSLSLPAPSKASAVIDIILEMSPENSTRVDRRCYQTEVLNTLMDQLLAADVLLGDQAALPAVSAGSGATYVQLTNNVFYLSGRIVDKLWQGTYTRDANEVFDFLSSLIAQAKRKASGVTLDNVYKSLNRTILYQLSRPINSVADQMNVLDALHKLTNNRSLILGPGNYDQEFIGCLCYCLLQLTANSPDNISSPPGLRRTTWHVESDAEFDAMATAALFDNKEACHLLSVAAQRVWDELYVCKKPTIEDIFKVTLPSVVDGPCKKAVTPELNAVRSVISDAASKLWVTYYENERKRVYSQTERIQSQLQSKLQKVGQGVMRLAIRKGRKDVAAKSVYVSSQEWQQSTAVHVSVVRDLVELQLTQYQQSKLHMSQYVMESWSVLERELTRERGLWGPPVGSDLDKWTLDMTEGPCRMRKKLVRDFMFYTHYPYKVQADSRELQKLKSALCIDSKAYYESYRPYSLLDGELLPLEGATEDNGTDDMSSAIELAFGEDGKPTDMALGTPRLLRNLPRLRPNQDYDEDTVQDSVDSFSTAELSSLGVDDASVSVSQVTDVSSVDGCEITATPTESTAATNNQIILRLLEEGEMITHMFRCARIQGLDTVEGLLVFVKEHFYIIDGFTLLRTKEIADIDSLPADLHDPIIPKTAKNPGIKRMCSKMAFDDMREVHKRRYLLQPIGVEVFSADGRNFLLAFPRKIRNKVFDRLQAVGTALTDSAQETVTGQKQSAKVEPGTGLISSLMGEKSVTQRWERGEISNFEYLMCLNTLAGRSYNDLMQYPVFPWIIADYDSQELDLNDPSTFRDLSRPMGAQTPDRLKQFEKRYNDWDDPTGETPPYHYGTHYSSAMIVASYLVRMEPFTQTFLHLQGGHFDLADRMFHSIKDAWLSAAKHNMADVKELIPEFFYLPEFLLNSNNFDLGLKQSGVPLGDVVLPAWAKADTREFIRAHREALECDFVSSKLNEWIDLIFGYKQQCPAAVEAVNVFHHLFYEGNVDIYAIDDPLKRTATIGFINNFGQIPKQLFKKPHPQKKLSSRNFTSAVNQIGPYVGISDRLFFHNVDNLKPTMQPVKELKGSVGQIIHSERHTVLAVEQNKALIPTSYGRFVAWGFPDMSIRVGTYDSDKASTVYENTDSGDILCAVCPNNKLFVSAGTSSVVNVWEFGKGREKHRLVLKQSLFGHTEAVTCLAASAAYNIIVTGSRDKTCIIWDLNELVFVRQLRGHTAPVAAVCINELTGDIATCAGTYLHLWSINGSEIANINTAVGRNQQILCVAMSQLKEWDTSNVIMTGNSDGVVRMWSLEFVEVADEDLRVKSCSSLFVAESDSPSVQSVTSPSPFVEHQQLVPGNKSSPVSIPTGRHRVDLSSRLGECNSSVDSDTGHMTSAVQQWLSAEHDGKSVAMTTDVDIGVDAVSLLSRDQQQQQLPGAKWSKSAPLDTVPAVGANTESPESGDFCFVSETDVKDASFGSMSSIHRRKLRDGFRWQKQLVFRSKLTMHTAFERKDNKDPAAVTALAVSRDHKSLYVGDAKGRVYAWSVSDQPGRSAVDHWVKDECGDSCVSCSVRFSFAERRHHCRNCGQLFCSKCSSFEIEIRRLRITKPVRVCQTCHTSIQQQNSTLDKDNKLLLRNPVV